MFKSKMLGLLFPAVMLANCTPPEVTARDNYLDYCASCHGPAGRGDGALSEHWPTPPADLTRLSAANRGVFPAARVMSMIDGYTRADQHGAVMPEFGPLLAGPMAVWEAPDGTLTPTPAALLALSEYIESIQEG